MSDIQVGDRVSVALPGYGFGVVLSIWGQCASVDFPGGSKHIPIVHLSSESALERRVKAVKDETERQKLEQQTAEIAREKASRRVLAFAELRVAMEADFLGVDGLYESKYSADLTLPDFVKMKASFAREWIEHNVGGNGASVKAPDAEQSKAIASLHGNVQVVARAGSGKTTTLVNRSMFLLKHCRVAPNELLLLAFNRKAAMAIRKSLLLKLVPEAGKQMQEEVEKARKHAKIQRRSEVDLESEAVEAVAERFAGRLPHVMTFHALAYAIVHPQGQILFDGQDSDSLGLSRAVQDVIDDFMQRPNSRDRIRNLMLAHFREDWDRIVAGGFNMDMEDMLALKRSLSRETLGGELVKSHGEKAIADFLFEHGIPYKYERNHWWSGVNYKPDFTIFTDAKQGVIIEYFGMAGNERYDKLTKEKQDYWAEKKGWSLISLFPWDLAEKDRATFEDILARELQSRGVACRRLSEEEIWQRVRVRAVDRFTRAATSFMGRCRKKSWSAEDLASRVHSHESSTASESEFISLAGEIFAAYLNRLDQTGDEDFDGLMQKAAEAIASGETAFLRKGGGGDVKALRFVCIDEFQDFSKLFHRLVEAMRQANEGLSFFCVGDDWQAINGFAGSELRFFSNFASYFGDATKLHISTNYRSTRQIVEVGNDLMTGMGTPAKASKREAGEVWLCDMADFEPTLIEKQRHPGDLITPLAARIAHRYAVNGKKVVFLGRRNGIPWYFNIDDDAGGRRGLDDFMLRVRACLPKDMRGMASISTAHKYKGLEKPAVVILDAVDRSYPLIHPDWPFFRIFGDTPLTLAEDDRRLFYVALTRAVESLVVITDSAAKSPFLDEIAQHRTMAKMPLKSFPPVFEEFNRRLLVKVKNATGKAFVDQGGTYPIKGLLLQCRYQYHGPTKTWEKSIAIEQFNLESIQVEPWALKAMNVEANFYNDADRLLASYKVDSGQWTALFDKWSAMEAQPPRLDLDGLAGDEREH